MFQVTRTETVHTGRSFIRQQRVQVGENDQCRDLADVPVQILEGHINDIACLGKTPDPDAQPLNLSHSLTIGKTFMIHRLRIVVIAGP